MYDLTMLRLSDHFVAWGWEILHKKGQIRIMLFRMRENLFFFTIPVLQVTLDRVNAKHAV